MIEIGIFLLGLIIGFLIIIKSGDLFVDEAATLGKRLGMSKLLIGLTIVAIGTSVPEIFTAIVAFFTSPNYSDYVIGTVMGSNISNVLLIFGLFILISGSFRIQKDELFNEMMLLVVSVIFILFVIVGFGNRFAILLLFLYLGYIYHLSRTKKKTVIKQEDAVVDIKESHSNLRATLFLSLSLIGLVIGARLIIYAIDGFGEFFNIPAAYLTLTTIAIGTSLPELAVTLISARKKETLIAIGNVLGSNIANICIVFGISGLFGYYAIETSLYIYSTFLFIISTILFSYLLFRKRIERYWGIIFLILFAIYLGSFFL